MKVLAFLPAMLVLLTLSSCDDRPTRNPVPSDLLADAHPYGIADPAIRFYGDHVDPARLEPAMRLLADLYRKRFPDDVAAGKPISSSILALSGGGPDGAYGAGLLNGWTARGDRPTFQVVTGISTGALMAPFAFLGKEYDDVLKQMFTDYSTADIARLDLVGGVINGDSVAVPTGLRKLIEKYADDELIAAIGKAYDSGRLLVIGTTNLDASRPVLWNIGAIANSGHPNAKKLIHDVLEASSAVPLALPPVMIPVDVNGTTYDEMHVDGGVTQQVSFLSPSVSLRKVDEFAGTEIDRTIYIIVNNQLTKAYSPVDPAILPVAAAAFSSLVSGSGQGDIYKIFAVAQRDGADMLVTAVPDTFADGSMTDFDEDYMRNLYTIGETIGEAGGHWKAHPHNFAP